MKLVPNWDIEIILSGVVCFLGLLFWFGRGSSALHPSRLNLKAKPEFEEAVGSDFPLPRAPYLEPEGRHRNLASGKRASRPFQNPGSEKASRLAESPAGFRILNVVFVWNGHPWDAFEVLGVPAGSSLNEVEVSYRDLVQRTDAQTKAFLDAAYTSILEEFRRSA